MGWINTPSNGKLPPPRHPVTRILALVPKTSSWRLSLLRAIHKRHWKNLHKLEFCTPSNSGRQKVSQNFCQKFSVIITNTCVFTIFRTKSELKCQNELLFLILSESLFLLLRFSDAFFDTLFDDSIWRRTKLQLYSHKWYFVC